MTDTLTTIYPSAEAPAPEPETAPVEDKPLTDRGRPPVVVQRDLAVARLLLEHPRPLQQVADEVAKGHWRTAYNSVCRLRERGLVHLKRLGTRTPVWEVTEKGVAWLTTSPPPPPTPSA